ncbi:MAG: homocysteine biosynthesis protein [Dethiobacteria bacterium]|nr:homocysteine biosynthesis protein [Bacillota bacterium]MDW7728989.1 homocysteine biosynthesis protein [Bacillota bacterium]
MKVNRSIEDINEKIRSGKAVVFTAEEIIDVIEEKGIAETAAQVDVVTTGTFGPMCSSGVFLNVGHPQPRIKLNEAFLNGVPAYAGIAAVDLYLGATSLPPADPANRNYPGDFLYGGGHVIEDLVDGKEIRLEATSYGTDCYPRKKIDTSFYLSEINEATLYNPRNAYQNYNVAVNLGDKTIYTYMGILKPNMGNANYSSAGQLSPLFNDPLLKTIGIGTRIFLGGGTGYVAWHGTQHNPSAERAENGTPKYPAATLALIGDLKQMKPKWLRGLNFLGYGATLQVGVGIPIPILNEEIMEFCAVRDEDIFAPIVDYNRGYPQREAGNLGLINYAELKSGMINIDGKKVPTASLSSYAGAREIAATLKSWIESGEFTLTVPAAGLPSVDAGIKLNTMPQRDPEEGEE